MLNVTFFKGPVVVLGSGKCSGIFSRHTVRHHDDDEVMLNVLRCQLTY